ncbi:MAG: pyridoxamine 5'-phosphate oxidase family protein [Desulfobacterium sp.]|jgi:hypothetical protein|nr:pyridoxamine 5'-phosphate oxidase family protein [Desulfobacterium sp.]
MDLKDYFKNISGTGILSTADNTGNVDAAVYSRPHLIEDRSLAFIMRDRLSHANLQSNPRAVYLFIEQGKGFNGKRLYLTMTKEEKNPELIASLQRRDQNTTTDGDRFLVYFTIDRERPIVGDFFEE